jgi:hypothetical protein
MTSHGQQLPHQVQERKSPEALSAWPGTRIVPEAVPSLDAPVLAFDHQLGVLPPRLSPRCLLGRGLRVMQGGGARRAVLLTGPAPIGSGFHHDLRLSSLHDDLLELATTTSVPARVTADTMTNT